MSDTPLQCACDKLQRLEGAATQAYITQFLSKTSADAEAIYYQCRECKTNWKKVEEAKRPSLVQIKEQ